MPEQVQRASTSKESEETTKPVSVRWWRRVATWFGQRLTYGVLGAVLSISLAANASLFAYIRLTRPAATPQSGSPEVELGSFEFQGPDSASAAIRGAKFALCISLLDGVDRTAREHLATSQHRVRQAVEELLRTAHGADFEDPDLSGLKRQVQEQLNGVLGVRAISEVIITDLSLQKKQGPAENKPQTAGSSSPPGAPSS